MSRDVPFVNRTFPGILSGDTTAELAGELYVVIQLQVVLVKLVSALHLVRFSIPSQAYLISNTSQSQRQKRD